MRFWGVIFLGLSVMALNEAKAYNEPYAGAMVKKENRTTPKADFNPSDITDIMPSVGKKEEKDVEIYFSADEMETDQENKIIEARGNVVVNRENLELVSDKIWYDQNKDIIIAEGNVKLTEADGSILYTDRITLSDKMNRAVVDKVKVILKDQSRIWADKFVKKVNDNKQMRNASYTACDMCNGKSPLWKIDARKVTYDAKGQNINYNDAVLKIKDVPVLYMPFMTHPAPEVKRRSGLLMTAIGSSSYLGQYIQPTYFWDVSDQTDVILSPYFTTDRDIVWNGQYRQYFYKGHVTAEGSFVNDNGTYKDEKFKNSTRPDKRGHLFLDARYEINDYWVSSLDLNYVSDLFYLKDMNLPDDDEAWLTNKLAFERFQGRNYTAIEGYYYKLTSYNLKRSNKKEYENRMNSLPEVMPFIEYEHISDPNKYGAYVKTNISSASVYRDNGEDQQRLSMINSWELPYMSRFGEQYKFVASLKSDLYYVDGYMYNQEDEYDGTLGRVFPQVGVEWRLPFVRATEESRQILEPVIVASFAPELENHNFDKIPNADSADATFDDANILSLDRYAGYDRNDDGSRVSYGLNWNSYGDIMGRTSAFIAQTYQLSDKSSFMEAVDDEERLSDYVGRVYASPHKYLDLNYRFRLDKDDLELNYSELGARVGSDILSVYGSYIYLQPNQNSYYKAKERKELYWSVSSRVTRSWKVGVYDRIDLTDDGGSLEQGGYVAYEDECMKLEFNAKKYYYDSDALDDDYEFGVTFFFKTLGGMGA